MDLVHLFSANSGDKPQRRLFAALDIGQEVITAGLWSVERGQVTMLKTSSPIEWQGDQTNDVIEASDVALEELGSDAEHINEVMFGLPPSWVINNDIEDTKKQILKKLCEELMLKPVGYVVTTEALNKFLCEQEGGPVHAILVEYATQTLIISLVKAGKIEKTEFVGRSTDSVSDLMEGLARFNIKQLPLQILLYSARMKQEELEKEKQTLLTYDWQASSLFLHIPNVEVLAQKIMIEAVCIAGGTAVAHALGLSQEEVKQEALLNEESEKKEPQKPVQKQEQMVINNETVDAQELGFEEVSPSEEVLSDESQDVQEEEKNGEDVQKTSKKKLPSLSLPKLPKLRVPKISMSRPHIALRFNFAIIGVVVFAMLAIGVASLFVMKSQSKAQVDILLKTSPITMPVEVTLDPKITQSQADLLVLKAQEITKDVTGEKTGSATGTRRVGDKATGSVTLYNATSSLKTFQAGTIITSSSGLKFELDTSVTVASSSGSASSIQPGTADVAVTANDIGADYNLAQEQEFTVSNFDKMTYVAKNAKAFSGGSSREVQVVSKSDQTKLRQDLLVELKQKALDALKQDKSSDMEIVILDTGNIKDEKFSTDVNKEAQSLSLTMTYTAKGLVYNMSDVKDIAIKHLTPTIPPNTVLAEEQTMLDVTNIVSATGSATVKVVGDLTSSTIPVLDIQKIKNMLVSKTVAQAKAVLSDQAGVVSSNIKIVPSIVQTIFNMMPSKLDNITVETRVQ